MCGAGVAAALLQAHVAHHFGDDGGAAAGAGDGAAGADGVRCLVCGRVVSLYDLDSHELAHQLTERDASTAAAVAAAAAAAAAADVVDLTGDDAGPAHGGGEAEAAVRIEQPPYVPPEGLLPLVESALLSQANVFSRFALCGAPVAHYCTLAEDAGACAVPCRYTRKRLVSRRRTHPACLPASSAALPPQQPRPRPGHVPPPGCQVGVADSGTCRRASEARLPARTPRQSR